MKQFQSKISLIERQINRLWTRGNLKKLVISNLGTRPDFTASQISRSFFLESAPACNFRLTSRRVFQTRFIPSNQISLVYHALNACTRARVSPFELFHRVVGTRRYAFLRWNWTEVINCLWPARFFECLAVSSKVYCYVYATVCAL